MNPVLSRMLRSPAVRTLALSALALTGAYALAQQMVTPQSKPPSEKDVKARTASGGYKPERMKNPNLAPHASRMTVTPPSDIPLERIKVPKGFQVELWAHGMPGARMMTRGSKGTIWAGTDAGLARLEGDHFVPVALAPGLVQVASLEAARGGALLVGTRAQGLFRLDGGRVTSWSVAEGLPTPNVTVIEEDTRGAVWAGTSCGGLRRFRPG